MAQEKEHVVTCVEEQDQRDREAERQRRPGGAQGRAFRRQKNQRQGRGWKGAHHTRAQSTVKHNREPRCEDNATSTTTTHKPQPAEPEVPVPSGESQISLIRVKRGGR